jgi:hypothetical protein
MSVHAAKNAAIVLADETDIAPKPKLVIPPPTGKCRQLTKAQIKALDMRMRGITIAQVAKEIKRNTRTVERWELKPAWQALKAEFIADAKARSKQLVQEHLEAVTAATCLTAVEDRNTTAQRTVLELGELLNTNTSPARATPLAQALAGIQVNVNVSTGQDSQDSQDSGNSPIDVTYTARECSPSS